MCAGVTGGGVDEDEDEAVGVEENETVGEGDETVWDETAGSGVSTDVTEEGQKSPLLRKDELYRILLLLRLGLGLGLRLRVTVYPFPFPPFTPFTASVCSRCRHADSMALFVTKLYTL